MNFQKPSEEELRLLPIESRHYAKIIFFSKDREEKQAAYKEIGDMFGGTKPGLGIYLENIALNHPDEKDRISALWALLDYGAQGIIKALNEDSSPKVRAQAALALVEWHTPGPIEDLGKRLTEEKDEYARSMAARALTELYDDETIPFLRKAMEDESELVRSEAIIGLAGNEKTKNEAKKFMEKDKSSLVRIFAAHNLKLFDDNMLPEAVKIMKEQKSESARLNAFYAIRSIKTEKSKEALFEALKSKDNPIKSLAIDSLAGNWKSNPTVYNSILKLINDKTDFIKLNAMRALCNIDFEKTKPVLIKAIKQEKTPWLWASLVYLLKEKSPEEFMKYAKEKLKSSDWQMSSAAISLLLQQEKEKALPYILKAAETNNSTKVLGEIPSIIQITRLPKAVDVLKVVLHKTKDSFIKYKCMNVLYAIGTLEAYSLVKELEKDSDAEIAGIAKQYVENEKSWKYYNKVNDIKTGFLAKLGFKR